MYVFSAFTYIIIVHCQTRFDLLFSIIINCVTYSVLDENLTCSMSTQLNSTGKTWKMDISGPGKCWKTHIKRFWKVVGNHFQFLYAPCVDDDGDDDGDDDDGGRMSMDPAESSRNTCQLSTRSWTITDEEGREGKVEGPGVVGESC